MSAGLSTQQMEYAARRLGQSSSILFLLRRAPYECDGDLSCMVIVTPPQFFSPPQRIKKPRCRCKPSYNSNDIVPRSTYLRHVRHPGFHPPTHRACFSRRKPLSNPGSRRQLARRQAFVWKIVCSRPPITGNAGGDWVAWILTSGKD